MSARYLHLGSRVELATILIFMGQRDDSKANYDPRAERSVHCRGLDLSLFCEIPLLKMHATV